MKEYKKVAENAYAPNPDDGFINRKDMYDQIDKENDQAYVDRDLKGISKYKALKTGVYEQKTGNAFGVLPPKKKVRHPIFQGISMNELKRGIIFSEVLGKPKGLQ